MSFSSKLRKYIEINCIVDSHLAKKFGITPAMMNKYLYSGSLPKYWRAKKIEEVTGGYISMQDMGY